MRSWLGGCTTEGEAAMSDLKAIVLPAAALLLSALLLLTTSLAFADQAPHSFDISPQALESALSEFARQGSQTILFAPAIVAGKMTKGIHGKFDPLQALTTLLQGTGLTFTTTKSAAILLGPPQGSPGGSHNPERGAEAEHSSLDEVIVTA